MPLEEALAELDSLKPGEHFSYQALAKKHGCVRSTLTRRHRGLNASRATKARRQRLLHPRDEVEVVQYIRGLTERHLMPTRQMIINIITPLCNWEPSDQWVTRFLHRNHDTLITAWTTPMETSRHEADSRDRYRLYFDLLHSKIKEHEVEAENTYNMDEKGFMIGVIGRSKRIFDKALYGKKQYKQSTHDGNREWVTVLATICADESTLPVGVIFPAKGDEVQQSWVREIDPEEHKIHFATSPNRWTSNDLGLAWLKQVFDRYTKKKARRKYRLLILDGHGSHVTKAFIDYCDKHRILLLIFPPHATHTLQPLDVVCFKSLAQNYSNELLNRHHTRLNWNPVDKSDFISLFWPSWKKTFTKPLVKRAFETTGICPPNPDVILDRFRTPTPPPPATPPEPSELQPAPNSPSWLKTQSLLRLERAGNHPGAATAVNQSLHQLHVQLELEKHKNAGLEEALAANKRKRKKKKVLPLSPSDPNLQGGAILYSPHAKQRADQQLVAQEHQKLEEEAAKKTRKEIQHQTKLLKEKDKEDKRKKRLREQEERACRDAKKRAEIEARKAARVAAKALRDAQKSIQLPKQAKGKALQQLQLKTTKSRGSAASRTPRVVHARSLTPPTQLAKSGRVIKPTKKW